jgi:hypothetical protein
MNERFLALCEARGFIYGPVVVEASKDSELLRQLVWLYTTKGADAEVASWCALMMGLALGDEARRRAEAPDVHVLHHGFALCGRPLTIPGGRWVRLGEADKATCPGCRAKVVTSEEL